MSVVVSVNTKASAVADKAAPVPRSAAAR